MVFSDVDEVHNIMDDLQEQQEISGEISEAISNPIGFGHDIDEVRKRPLPLLPDPRKLPAVLSIKCFTRFP
jgi:Snf7